MLSRASSLNGTNSHEFRTVHLVLRIKDGQYYAIFENGWERQQFSLSRLGQFVAAAMKT